MEKKAYTPPTITEQGPVVEQTKGLGGKYWEFLNPKPVSSVDLEEEQD
jgi:hypothetical protein